MIGHGGSPDDSTTASVEPGPDEKVPCNASEHDDGLRQAPVLFFVVPCFNEEEVLPVSLRSFADELGVMVSAGAISPESRVLFVDDGSSDRTWSILQHACAQDPRLCAISLSRNRGHQNALVAGMMEARGKCDAIITIDCDGQDDIHASRQMVEEYRHGADVVYGTRSSRDVDSSFKRFTAEAFYRLMEALGAEVVFNHADYRLLSSRALDGLAQFGEVNLFLRGLVPLVGYPSATVEYERLDRAAGSSHYPLAKMLGLAVDGITSLSTKPMRMIMIAGALFFGLGLLLILYALVSVSAGTAVAGWASTVCIVSLIGGLQLLALGIIGEYVGKIYLETKSRPRYLVQERIGFHSANTGKADA